MTYKEIQELNAVEPFCFEDDTQEQWYKYGLVEGAKIGYEQAEKDLMDKAKQWFTDNIPSEKVQLLWCGFEQFITEN